MGLHKGGLISGGGGGGAASTLAAGATGVDLTLSSNETVGGNLAVTGTAGITGLTTLLGGLVVKSTALLLGKRVSDDVTIWTINTQNGGMSSASGFTVNSGGGTQDNFFNATGTFRLNSKVVCSATAPTVVAGAGAAITAGMSFAFEVNLGGAAQTGTFTLPAATTNWCLTMANITNPDSFILSQTGGTSTTATFSCYSRTTGLLANWTANDLARCIAIAY